MNIIVKEIDRLKSSRVRGKVISQYLVYAMADNVAVACEEIFGKEELGSVIDYLIIDAIMQNNPFLEFDQLAYNEAVANVQYITYEEVKLQDK